MKIDNIMPRNGNIDFSKRGAYTPAKKNDCGSYFLIFVSGIEPLKQEDSNNTIAEDIETQTHQVFEQIENILRLAGASLDNEVKAVIYLTDMNDFKIVSPIRAQYFEKSMPVSTMIEVNRLKRDGAKIEIEVTAIIGK